jgi:hypothetical protein
MEKIKQILTLQGIEFDEGDILSAASAIGMDVDNLNDAEAQEVAIQVAQAKKSTALTTANGKSKNGNGNGKLGKNSSRRKSVPPLQGAISLTHLRFQIKKFNPWRMFSTSGLMLTQLTKQTNCYQRFAMLLKTW